MARYLCYSTFIFNIANLSICGDTPQIVSNGGTSFDCNSWRWSNQSTSGRFKHSEPIPAHPHKTISISSEQSHPHPLPNPKPSLPPKNPHSHSPIHLKSHQHLCIVKPPNKGTGFIPCNALTLIYISNSPFQPLPSALSKSNPACSADPDMSPPTGPA